MDSMNSDPSLAVHAKAGGSVSEAIHLRRLRRVAAFEMAVSALGSAASALDVSPSPQAARSVQATVNLIRSVEQRYGLLAPAEAGIALGSVSASPRNLAASRRRAGELIAIKYRGKNLYPGFQFTSDQESLEVIKTLRTMAADNDWSEYDLFAWLVTPRGRLDGDVPADLLTATGSQTKNLTDRVLAAAELEMHDDW